MSRFVPRVPLRYSLRGRVLVYSLLATSVLGIVGLFSQINTQIFLKDMLYIFQRNQVFLELEDSMDSITTDLEGYLATKSSSALRQYWTDSLALRQLLRNLERRPFNDQTSLLRKNIVTLTEAWLKDTEGAVNAKRGRDVQAYTEAFYRAERKAGFVHNSMDQLNLRDFRDSIKVMKDFNYQLAMLQIFSILMIVTLMGLGIVLAFWFSWKLTEPLDELAQAARKISEGSYQDAVVSYGRDDEIGLLASAFERMRTSIVRSIQELKEKAEIENGLMEERLKNLRMKNLLKNAELQTLQAQINPHFLFNTLNAGIQLAVIEDANQTRLFMENLADMLRHNVRRLDKPVWLSEEIRSLESYLYILRIRFADRYDFRIRLCPDFKDIKMPSMILQPLVENSLIHGLSDREEGGWVEIRVDKEPGGQFISVSDNGVGMPPEVMQRVLANPEPGEEYLDGDEGILLPGKDKDPDGSGRSTGHYSTGIGLGNVISRMGHFFGKPSLVSIESSLDQGCRIAFHLPDALEEEHVQSIDRR